MDDAFSGHLPRVGMAQDLSASGCELPELMAAGRWESPQMPARYTRSQAAARGRLPVTTEPRTPSLKRPHRALHEGLQ